MGLGYVDSVIVYNDYYNDTAEKQLYFGTRFDNVRVELNQGATIRQSGIENADSCLVKIPNAVFPKPYKPPELWNDLTTDEMQDFFTFDKDAADNFFAIVKKKELGIDIDLPVGVVDGYAKEYNGNFSEWLKLKYGYVYKLTTVDVYGLIPRFEIGGK